LRIGVKEEGIRFRQHKPKEMAHYAKDCWDCELLTSYGWVECVGIADRSAYDLERHSEGTNKPIVAARPLDHPRTEDQIKVILNKGELGKQFKKEASVIFDYVENLSNEEKTNLKKTIEESNEYKFESGGKQWVLKKQDVVEFKVTKVTINEEKFIPGIIEPAFGFGRILYALLEHNFYMRDKERTLISIPPSVAPIKCSILPLMAKPELLKFVSDIETNLKKAGLPTKVDKTGLTIGKRYARTDEIGIPLGITIDFDTIEKGLVTLREALSTKQVQLPLAEVTNVVKDLCSSQIQWEDVLKKYPLYEGNQDEEK